MEKRELNNKDPIEVWFQSADALAESLGNFNWEVEKENSTFQFR